MEYDNKMNKRNDPNIIGRCCNKKGKFIILYNGSPTENYSIILCDDHNGEPPYNKNILKIFPMEEL